VMPLLYACYWNYKRSDPGVVISRPQVQLKQIMPEVVIYNRKEFNNIALRNRTQQKKMTTQIELRQKFINIYTRSQ